MDDPLIIDLIFENGIATLDDYDEVKSKLKCTCHFLNNLLSIEDKRLQVRLLLEKVIDSLIILNNLMWRFFPKYDRLFLALNRFCLRWEKQIIECLGEKNFQIVLNQIYYDCWGIDNFDKFTPWSGWVNGKFVCISRLWGIKLSMYYRGCLVKQMFPQLFPQNLILSIFKNNVEYVIDLHRRLKKLLIDDSNRRFIRIASRRLISILDSSQNLRCCMFFVPPCYEFLFQMLHERYFPRFLDPCSLMVFDSLGNSLSMIENENQTILKNCLSKDQKCIDLLMEIDKFDSLDIEVLRSVQETNLSLYQTITTS